MEHDLSFTDIRFLRIVRDINANPDAYEGTDKGERPASTGAIITASDLSESAVRYRLGGSRSRGFEEMGLTKIHEAEFDEETRTFGAKSVELTQEGVDILTEIGDMSETGGSEGGGDTDVPELVKQLRGRVEKLEERSKSGGSGDDESYARKLNSLENDIERIETKLDAIRDDPWGGLGDDAVEITKEGVDKANAMFYILQTVFGIDVERRTEEGSYPSEEAIEAERVEIAERLSSAEYLETGESSDGQNVSVPEGEDEVGDITAEGEAVEETDVSTAVTKPSAPTPQQSSDQRKEE